MSMNQYRWTKLGFALGVVITLGACAMPGVEQSAGPWGPSQSVGPGGVKQSAGPWGPSQSVGPGGAQQKAGPAQQSAGPQGASQGAGPWGPSQSAGPGGVKQCAGPFGPCQSVGPGGVSQGFGKPGAAPPRGTSCSAQCPHGDVGIACAAGQSPQCRCDQRPYASCKAPTPQRK